MLIIKRDLRKLIKWFRNLTDKPIGQMLHELQSRLKKQAAVLGIRAETVECDYCDEGRFTFLVSGQTERCFVVYNPEHTDWMRVVCTLHRMGNVNYYEFYELAESVKLPVEQEKATKGKGGLFHHAERDRKYWEKEIVRIIKGLGG